MSVDTEQERRSTLGVLPVANSLVDRFDRRAVWRIYSGSAAPFPVATRYTLIGSDTSKPALFTDVRSYSDELDGMLVASPTGSYLPIFSTEDFTGNDSVYNTDCWAADLDFTGCAWYGVDSAGDPVSSNDKKTGTLISPRHAMVAWHSFGEVGFGVGAKITWVAADGTRYRRTILGASDEIGRGTDHDAQVVYYGKPGLDGDDVAAEHDLPDSLANYRVLPADYETHVPEFPEYSVTSTNVSPIIVLDQERQALVRDWYETSGPQETNDYMYARNSSTGNRASYTEKLLNGDSSHPWFVLMNGELVLLSATFTINTVTPPYVSVSPFYPTDIDAINAAMLTLENDNGGSDGYQLSIWEPPADVQSVLVGGASEKLALVGV